MQTDGSYNVYIESLYVNGTRFNTDTICENVIYNGTNGWWTLNSSSQFNAIFTQTSKAGWKLDNILIYEPYDVYMTDLNVVNKTVKIVNDGSNAVTGNVFIALYDNDKNLLAAKEASTELSVPAGGSQTVSLDDDTFGHENAKNILLEQVESCTSLCGRNCSVIIKIYKKNEWNLKNGTHFVYRFNFRQILHQLRFLCILYNARKTCNSNEKGG